MATQYTGWQRVFVGATYSAVIMGVGYLCYRYLTPSRESVFKSLPPDAQRAAAAYDTADQRKVRSFLDTLQENAASDRPVWDVRPAAAPSARTAAGAPSSSSSNNR